MTLLAPSPFLSATEIEAHMSRLKTLTDAMKKRKANQKLNKILDGHAKYMKKRDKKK